MALKKAEREAVRAKFGGRCAYCGCMLGERWHADHIEPLRRNDWCKVPSGPEHPERDTVENHNPSCPPCNIDKHSMGLEDWRGMIQRTNEVLARDVSTFRRALRYGLVTLNPAPVVFYFEQVAATKEPS